MPKARAGMKKDGDARTRNPVRTRKNILEASLKLFAEKGVNGTSMRDIALEAGENLGMIYYYFDDKSDLYNAVMMGNVIGAIGGVLAEEANTRGTASQRLSRLLKSYIDFSEQNPDQAMMLIRGLVRLIEREETPFVDLVNVRLQVVEDLVREGQAAGEFGKVNTSVFSYMFIAAMMTHFLSNMIAGIYPGKGFKHMSEDDILDFFKQVMLAGLKSKPTPGKK